MHCCTVACAIFAVSLYVYLRVAPYEVKGPRLVFVQHLVTGDLEGSRLGSNHSRDVQIGYPLCSTCTPISVVQGILLSSLYDTLEFIVTCAL